MARLCRVDYGSYMVADMALATAVHTVGVNWESVGTIIAATVAAMSFIFGLFARYISGRITAAIDRFRIDVISKMDVRISILEEKSIDSGNRRRL